MTKFTTTLKGLLIFLLALTIIGCSKDDDNPVEPGEGTDYSEILNSFSSKTAVATYAEMKANADLLNQSVETFRQSSTQANLNAACDYWKATRKPWEASEAFLFGPAAFLSLDPSLDSWPLDQAQLEEVLNSNFELTPDFIREGLGFSLRGFHTIEFLLFRDGQPRNAEDVTDREKEYLVAVTEVLYEDAATLHDEWAGGFADEFMKAGNSGSRYLSQEAAVQEMVEGIIGIADEVGNGKLADPYNSKNVLEVESWFSWNSLTDFENNIKSIQNTYLGGYDESSRGESLSDFIQTKDAALDVKIKSEIEAAINAIKAIPSPFRNNLSADAQIQAAMAACNKIMTTFQSEVRPLITN